MRQKIFSLLFLGISILLLAAPAQMQDRITVTSSEVEVMSGGRAYLSYLAAPTEDGPYPAVVLIHSFNGLQDGYKTMTDQLAGEGFVVLAIGWQTFERGPSDKTMLELVEDSAAFLGRRADVDPTRIGLTGFCAGGRYTMLFLPQSDMFKAGVAWYGFPYNGSPSAADLVGDLSAPLLIIHGTEDTPSPIANIYRYAGDLQTAGATFELKVYSGEPHGFMLEGGQLRIDDIATDAFNEMADFFKRKL